MPLLIAISVVVAGCGTPKPTSEVYFGPKPTPEEAGAKINAYLDRILKDPGSKQVRCTDPSDKAYLWEGVGNPAKYGYIVECDVNAKNSFGGYTGDERMVFRFNGAEFEYHKIVIKTALMAD